MAFAIGAESLQSRPGDPAHQTHRGTRLKIRSRFLTRLAALLIVLLARLLFRTCRKRYRVEAPGINPYLDTGPTRYLYCVWHDHILMTVFSGRPKNMAGLVSRHQDGSFLAEAMKRLGIEPVRGSTSRGGAQAMRQMLDLARDRHIAITPDGPRGPRRQAKSGLVFLASQTGRPIVPVVHACRRGWSIRGSWTDMLVPKPFTTLYALAGRPLAVPPNLSREELAAHTARLQAEMERLEHDIQRWMAGRSAEAMPATDAVRSAA